MPTNSPPQFLHLLAHDLRWQLLASLAQSDHRVGELVEQTGRPANLVSYHLGRLRQFGLVRERRSSVDGRDIYYALDLDLTRSLFHRTARQLHPVLWQELDGQSRPDGGTDTPVRVLFLCTHNSARSQMAEGLLRQFGAPAVDAFSAGDYPGDVHPFAIRAMADMGIDISEQRAKHKDVFDGQAFDYVVTVCDFARENCPAYANEPVHIHWSIADPVAHTGHDSYEAFNIAAQDLEHRVRHLLARVASDKGAAPNVPARPDAHEESTVL